MSIVSNIRNGVDVDKLMTAVEAVKSDPTNGRLTFTVRSKWTGALTAEHTPSTYEVGRDRGQHQKAHTIRTDEPREILGSDTGISPAETILTSLASCLAVGYAANAAANGIDLQEVSFEITGKGDLQGFMNIGTLRPGLSEISVKTTVKSNASQEKLRELHDYVNTHSPIWDTIANPVKLTSQLITK
jgi:uncharacterized OsmC-like protein